MKKTLFFYLSSLLDLEFFELLSKSLGGVVETACYMSRRNLWLEIYFFEKCFFPKTIFGARAKTFRSSGDALYGDSVGTAFYMSMASIRMKQTTLLQKSHKPLLFLDCFQKIFRGSGWSFPTNLSNNFPCVQRSIRRNYDLHKSCSSIHFWSLSEKYSDVCQNWFVILRGIFPKRNNFFCELKTSYQSCWTLNKNYSHFIWKTFVSFVKTPFYVSNRFSEELESFWEIRNTLVFKNLGNKLSDFGQKISGKVWKNPFPSPLETFEQVFFSD